MSEQAVEVSGDAAMETQEVAMETSQVVTETTDVAMEMKTDCAPEINQEPAVVTAEKAEEKSQKPAVVSDGGGVSLKPAVVSDGGGVSQEPAVVSGGGDGGRISQEPVVMSGDSGGEIHQKPATMSVDVGVGRVIQEPPTVSGDGRGEISQEPASVSGKGKGGEISQEPASVSGKGKGGEISQEPASVSDGGGTRGVFQEPAVKKDKAGGGDPAPLSVDTVIKTAEAVADKAASEMESQEAKKEDEMGNVVESEDEYTIVEVPLPPAPPKKIVPEASKADGANGERLSASHLLIGNAFGMKIPPPEYSGIAPVDLAPDLELAAKKKKKKKKKKGGGDKEATPPTESSSVPIQPTPQLQEDPQGKQGGSLLGPGPEFDFGSHIQRAPEKFPVPKEEFQEQGPIDEFGPPPPHLRRGGDEFGPPPYLRRGPGPPPRGMEEYDYDYDYRPPPRHWEGEEFGPPQRHREYDEFGSPGHRTRGRYPRRGRGGFEGPMGREPFDEDFGPGWRGRGGRGRPFPRHGHYTYPEDYNEEEYEEYDRRRYGPDDEYGPDGGYGPGPHPPYGPGYHGHPGSHGGPPHGGPPHGGPPHGGYGPRGPAPLMGPGQGPEAGPHGNYDHYGQSGPSGPPGQYGPGGPGFEQPVVSGPPPFPQEGYPHDGQNYPPHDGQNYPPPHDGQNYPPPHDGQNYPPPPHDGQNYPPPHDGQNFPPQDGQNFPPQQTGQNYPPNMFPPNMEGQQQFTGEVFAPNAAPPVPVFPGMPPMPGGVPPPMPAVPHMEALPSQETAENLIAQGMNPDLAKILNAGVVEMVRPEPEPAPVKEKKKKKKKAKIGPLPEPDPALNLADVPLPPMSIPLPNEVPLPPAPKKEKKKPSMVPFPELAPVVHGPMLRPEQPPQPPLPEPPLPEPPVDIPEVKPPLPPMPADNVEMAIDNAHISEADKQLVSSMPALQAEPMNIVPEETDNLISGPPVLYSSVPSTDMQDSQPVTLPARKSRFDQNWQSENKQRVSSPFDPNTVSVPPVIVVEDVQLSTSEREREDNFNASLYDDCILDAEEDDITNERNGTDRAVLESRKEVLMETLETSEDGNRSDSMGREMIKTADGYIYYGNKSLKQQELKPKEQAQTKETITAAQLLEKFKQRKQIKKPAARSDMPKLPPIAPLPSVEKPVTKDDSKAPGKFTFAIRKLKQIEAEQEEEEKQVLNALVTGLAKEDKPTEKAEKASDKEEKGNSAQNKVPKAKPEESEIKKEKSLRDSERSSKDRPKKTESAERRKRSRSRSKERRRSDSRSVSRDRRSRSTSRSRRSRYRRSSSRSRRSRSTDRYRDRSRSRDRRRRYSRERSYSRDKSMSRDRRSRSRDQRSRSRDRKEKKRSLSPWRKDREFFKRYGRMPRNGEADHITVESIAKRSKSGNQEKEKRRKSRDRSRGRESKSIRSRDRDSYDKYVDSESRDRRRDRGSRERSLERDKRSIEKDKRSVEKDKRSVEKDKRSTEKDKYLRKSSDRERKENTRARESKDISVDRESSRENTESSGENTDDDDRKSDRKSNDRTSEPRDLKAVRTSESRSEGSQKEDGEISDKEEQSVKEEMETNLLLSKEKEHENRGNEQIAERSDSLERWTNSDRNETLRKGSSSAEVSPYEYGPGPPSKSKDVEVSLGERDESNYSDDAVREKSEGSKFQQENVESGKTSEAEMPDESQSLQKEKYEGNKEIMLSEQRNEDYSRETSRKKRDKKSVISESESDEYVSKKGKRKSEKYEDMETEKTDKQYDDSKSKKKKDRKKEDDIEYDDNDKYGKPSKRVYRDEDEYERERSGKYRKDRDITPVDQGRDRKYKSRYERDNEYRSDERNLPKGRKQPGESSSDSDSYSYKDRKKQSSKYKDKKDDYQSVEKMTKSKWDSTDSSESEDEYEKPRSREQGRRGYEREDSESAATSSRSKESALLKDKRKFDIDISKINKMKHLDKLMKARGAQKSDESHDSSDEDEQVKHKQKKDKHVKKKAKKDKKKYEDSDSETEDSPKGKKKKKAKKKKSREEEEREIQEKHSKKKRLSSEELSDAEEIKFKKDVRKKKGKKGYDYDEHSDMEVSETEVKKKKGDKMKKKDKEKVKKQKKYESEDSEDATVYKKRGKAKSNKHDEMEYRSSDDEQYEKVTKKKKKKRSKSRHLSSESDEGLPEKDQKFESKRKKKRTKSRSYTDNDEEYEEDSRNQRKADKRKKNRSKSVESNERLSVRSRRTYREDSREDDRKSREDVRRRRDTSESESDHEQYKQKPKSLKEKLKREEKTRDSIDRRARKDDTSERRTRREAEKKSRDSSEDIGRTKSRAHYDEESSPERSSKRRGEKDENSSPERRLSKRREKDDNRRKREFSAERKIKRKHDSSPEVERVRKRNRSYASKSRSKSRTPSRTKVQRVAKPERRRRSSDHSEREESKQREKRRKRDVSSSEEDRDDRKSIRQKKDKMRERRKGKDDSSKYHERGRRSSYEESDQEQVKAVPVREKRSRYNDSKVKRSVSSERRLKKDRGKISESENSSESSTESSASSSESNSDSETNYKTKRTGSKNVQAGAGSSMELVPGSQMEKENIKVDNVKDSFPGKEQKSSEDKVKQNQDDKGKRIKKSQRKSSVDEKSPEPEPLLDKGSVEMIKPSDGDTGKSSTKKSKKDHADKEVAHQGKTKPSLDKEKTDSDGMEKGKGLKLLSVYSTGEMDEIDSSVDKNTDGTVEKTGKHVSKESQERVKDVSVIAKHEKDNSKKKSFSSKDTKKGLAPKKDTTEIKEASLGFDNLDVEDMDVESDSSNSRGSNKKTSPINEVENDVNSNKVKASTKIVGNFSAETLTETSDLAVTDTKNFNRDECVSVKSSLESTESSLVKLSKVEKVKPVEENKTESSSNLYDPFECTFDKTTDILDTQTSNKLVEKKEPLKETDVRTQTKTKVSELASQGPSLPHGRTYLGQVSGIPLPVVAPVLPPPGVQVLAPVTIQLPASVAVQPPAPFAITPVAVQPPARLAVQPPAPVVIQPTANVAVQPTAPVAIQPSTPVAKQPAAAVTIQPPAPVAIQPPAPVAIQPPAPVAIQPPARVAVQPPATVASPIFPVVCVPPFIQPVLPVPEPASASETGKSGNAPCPVPPVPVALGPPLAAVGPPLVGFGVSPAEDIKDRSKTGLKDIPLPEVPGSSTKIIQDSNKQIKMKTQIPKEKPKPSRLKTRWDTAEKEGASMDKNTDSTKEDKTDSESAKDDNQELYDPFALDTYDTPPQSPKQAHTVDADDSSSKSNIEVQSKVKMTFAAGRKLISKSALGLDEAEELPWTVSSKKPKRKSRFSDKPVEEIKETKVTNIIEGLSGNQSVTDLSKGHEQVEGDEKIMETSVEKNVKLEISPKAKKKDMVDTSLHETKKSECKVDFLEIETKVTHRSTSDSHSRRKRSPDKKRSSEHRQDIHHRERDIGESPSTGKKEDSKQEDEEEHKSSKETKGSSLAEISGASSQNKDEAGIRRKKEGRKSRKGDQVEEKKSDLEELDKAAYSSSKTIKAVSDSDNGKLPDQDCHGHSKQKKSRHGFEDFQDPDLKESSKSYLKHDKGKYGEKFTETKAKDIGVLSKLCDSCKSSERSNAQECECTKEMGIEVKMRNIANRGSNIADTNVKPEAIPSSDKKDVSDIPFPEMQLSKEIRVDISEKVKESSSKELRNIKSKLVTDMFQEIDEEISFKNVVTDPSLIGGSVDLTDAREIVKTEKEEVAEIDRMAVDSDTKYQYEKKREGQKKIDKVEKIVEPVVTEQATDDSVTEEKGPAKRAKRSGSKTDTAAPPPVKRLTRRRAAEENVVLPPVMSKDMPTRIKRGRRSSVDPAIDDNQVEDVKQIAGDSEIPDSAGNIAEKADGNVKKEAVDVKKSETENLLKQGQTDVSTTSEAFASQPLAASKVLDMTEQINANLKILASKLKEKTEESMKQSSLEEHLKQKSIDMAGNIANSITDKSITNIQIPTSTSAKTDVEETVTNISNKQQVELIAAEQNKEDKGMQEVEEVKLTESSQQKGFTMKFVPSVLLRTKQDKEMKALDHVFDTSEDLSDEKKPLQKLKEHLGPISFGLPEFPTVAVATEQQSSNSGFGSSTETRNASHSKGDAKDNAKEQEKESRDPDKSNPARHPERSNPAPNNPHSSSAAKAAEKTQNPSSTPHITYEEIGNAIQVIGQENLRRIEVLQRESARLMQEKGNKIEVLGQPKPQETMQIEVVERVRSKKHHASGSSERSTRELLKLEDKELFTLEREKEQLLTMLDPQPSQREPEPARDIPAVGIQDLPTPFETTGSVLSESRGDDRDRGDQMYPEEFERGRVREREYEERDRDRGRDHPHEDRDREQDERGRDYAFEDKDRNRTKDRNREDRERDRKRDREHLDDRDRDRTRDRERDRGRRDDEEKKSRREKETYRSRERSRDRDSYRGRDRKRSRDRERSRERDRSRERRNKKRKEHDDRYDGHRSSRRSRSRSWSRESWDRGRERRSRSRGRRSRSRDRRSRSRERRSRSRGRRSKSRERRSRSRERFRSRRSSSRSRERRSRSKDRESRRRDRGSSKDKSSKMSALEKFEKELAEKKKVLLQPVSSVAQESKQADSPVQTAYHVDQQFPPVEAAPPAHYLPQPFPVHEQPIPIFQGAPPDQVFPPFPHVQQPAMFQSAGGSQFYPEGMPPDPAGFQMMPRQPGMPEHNFPPQIPIPPEHFPQGAPGCFPPGPPFMGPNFMGQGPQPGPMGPMPGQEHGNMIYMEPPGGNSINPPPPPPPPPPAQFDTNTGHPAEITRSQSLDFPSGHHIEPGYPVEGNPDQQLQQYHEPDVSNYGYQYKESEPGFKFGIGGPGVPGHPVVKPKTKRSFSDNLAQSRKDKEESDGNKPPEVQSFVQQSVEEKVKLEEQQDESNVYPKSTKSSVGSLTPVPSPTDENKDLNWLASETSVTAEKNIQGGTQTEAQFALADPASQLVKIEPTSEAPEEPTAASDDIQASAELATVDDMNDSDAASDKPMKVKSRWRRASEAEVPPPPPPSKRKDKKGSKEGREGEVKEETASAEVKDEAKPDGDDDDEEVPINFELISENIYLTDRKRSKQMREVRRMVCDCTTSREDREMGAEACGEDCLNRMLFIECGSKCPCGEYCTNKRFQKIKNAPVKPFQTTWKGYGLKAEEDLEQGQFVMEYVGEVLDYRMFKSRSKQYSKAGQQHFYFMAVNPEEIVDATVKGNISRFINHSCDPNCETQKWTINGVLRVGFFVRKPIKKDEEITFDYKYEVYGQEAQKCYCGSSNCRGWLGGDKRVELRSSRRTSVDELEIEKKRKELFDDSDKLEEELDRMSELEEGLRNKNDVLNICRLMVRAEDPEHRMQILKLLESTTETACLRLFIDYHGLPLLWCWMADIKQTVSDLKILILKVLKKLPITNKTILTDTKILEIVQKWSQPVEDIPDLVAETTETTDNNTEDDTDTLLTPPVTSNKNPVSILASLRDTKAIKKKVKFADEASSSDSESRTSASEEFQSETVEADVSSSSQSGKPKKFRMELRRKVLDKDKEMPEEVAQSSEIDSQTEAQSEEATQEVSQEEAAESESEKAPAESSEAAEAEVEKSDTVKENVREEVERAVKAHEIMAIAKNLLEHWSGLKEVYKIPKKEVLEERKKMERELDTRFEKVIKFEDVKKRISGWERAKKRKREPSLKDDTDDSDSGTARKSYLVTPPKMSKSERRQLFEAQVKARDEKAAEYQRQQQEQLEQLEQEQYVQYQHMQQLMQDPSFMFYATQDFNFLPSIGIDPQTFIQQLTMDPVLLQQFMTTNPNFPQQLENLTIMYQQAVMQNEYAQQGYPPEVTAPMGMVQQQVEGEREPMTEQHMAFLAQVEAFKQQYLDPTPKIAATTTVDDEDVPPPPSPPKSKPVVLPPNWKTARDAEGKLYYYHTVTRQTQWDPPNLDTGEHTDDNMDLGTPTQDDFMSKFASYVEPKPLETMETTVSEKKKEKEAIFSFTTTTAAADTSSEMSKKLKEHFKSKMSSWIVVCLNPFRKQDCKLGRISNTEDFKHLARKLTHHVMAKELKHCKHVEDLEVNENVKSKAKDFVKKYMTKFGESYKRSGNSPTYD